MMKNNASLIDEFRETLQLVHRYGRKLMAQDREHGEEFESTDPMRCKIFKLPMMQKQVIHYIVAHQGQDIYQKDIEKAFVISRSTASTMMKSLESKGMITRESVPTDARLKRIVLNEEVQKRFDDVHAHMIEHIYEICDQMMAGLSDEEVKQFIQTLSRMKNNLKEGESSDD